MTWQITIRPAACGDRGPAQAALSRPGRYQTVRDNLRVKEVRVGTGDASKRFIVCHNPGEVDRDKQTRDDTFARLEAELTPIATARAKTETAKANAAHHRAECALRNHPTLGRYVRQTKTGRLLIDRAKIARSSGAGAGNRRRPVASVRAAG